MARRGTTERLCYFCLILMTGSSPLHTASHSTSVISTKLEVQPRSYSGHRTKRVAECPTNLDPAGYYPLNQTDVTVTFFNDSHQYTAIVRWKTPPAKNETPLLGYSFWLSTGGVGMIPCYHISKTVNSFKVDTNMGWEYDSNLLFLIEPQPLRHHATTFLVFPPLYEEAKEATTNAVNHFQDSRRRASTTTTSTSEYHNKVTFTAPVIAGVAVGALALLASFLGVVRCIRYKKSRNCYKVRCTYNRNNKNSNQQRANNINVAKKDYFYVTYCPENGSFMSKIVDFATWFREQGYDVQMDIMQTPSNEAQLRELGRFRFGELQLRKAKNVFMILSPRYLRLCKLDEEGEANLENLSHQERIVFSEIAQIRNELCSTIYRNGRFVPVLFGVKETELPFWIKEMVVYSWPEDQLNKRLLFRLDEQVEYQM